VVPAWKQNIADCTVDKIGKLGWEGIAALSTREVAIYCVTPAPKTPPQLSSRDHLTESSPSRLTVLFIDAATGQITQKASWPMRVGRRPGILAVDDTSFLLNVGSEIDLIDRKNLSTSKRLLLEEPTLVFGRQAGGCAEWSVIVSPDGATFATSRMCYAPATGDTSEIYMYRCKDFMKIGNWKSPGNDFYGLLDDDIVRSPSENGPHYLYFSHAGGVEEQVLTRPHGFQSLFLDREHVVCCNRSESLTVMDKNGDIISFLNIDPNFNGYDARTQADQVFVSKMGQRIAALVFNVGGFGSFKWECDVFDRKLNRLLQVGIPRYKHDLTAALAPDDKHVFILIDADVIAYTIP
jgi:hypothetical protein